MGEKNKKKKKDFKQRIVPVFRSIRYSRFLGPLFPLPHPGFAFFNYCETYTRRPHRPSPSAPINPLAPPPCPNPQSCTDCLLSYSFSIIFVSITLALDSSYLGTTLCYYYLYYFYYYFYYYHSKLRSFGNPRKVAAKVVVQKKNGKSP